MTNSSRCLPTHRTGLSNHCTYLVLALLMQGCSSLPERAPLPEASYPESTVIGMTGVRYWGDEPPPLLAEGLSDDSTAEELKAALPGFFGREMHFLAISGGGANGAFAAGLLNGWSDEGSRPEFNVVTGISTGALIAPFAFLGSEYDRYLERFYTQYGTEDLVTEQGLIRSFFFRDAAYDTAPLRARLAEYIDEEIMAAIAAERRNGRLLLIGTTNLDAGRPVIWDVGAIADSGKPGALNLIRDVVLASASIPIAFPPVLIEVEANGEIYDEMHTDGGVSRQAFLFQLSSAEDTFENLGIVGKGNAYLIRNSKLEPTWQPVERSMLAIAGRSAGSLVYTQGAGDLYREFLAAMHVGFNYNLAYIPASFDAKQEELFDPNYMRELFQFAYDMAVDGYPWENLPPGFDVN